MGQSSKKISIVRVIKLFFTIVFGFYFFVCAVVAVFQRSLIYHPRTYFSSDVNQMAQSANLQRWTNSAGQPIGFKHLSPTQPAEGSILVTYGNAASAIDCAHYAGDIQPVAAMDIYILEYPGYEDRPGSPTETKIFQAGEDAFQSIPTNHPIYLVGESLGTGPASYLAGTFSNRVAGIALISPFDTLASPARYEFPYLPVSLLLMDRFSSVDYLQNYHGKIAIAVDGADEIVPTKSGLRLYDSYNGPKKLWEFKNAGHCQIYSPVSEFWKGVVDFWRSSP